MIALDSNVVFDLMRGRSRVRENHFGALSSGVPISISVLVAEELAFAVRRCRDPQRELTLMRGAMGAVEVTAFEPQDAEAVGRIRALMEARGRRAPYADFLIGAHAAARGHKLVTANTRHLQNIPGLELVDWTQPPADPQDPHA